MVNSALHWLPVEIYGPRLGDKRPGGRYIFERIVVPGYWRSDPIQEVGDVVLMHADADLRARPGLRRIVSAGLIERLTVLAMDPCRQCETCNAVLPRTEKVFDVGALGNTVLPDGDWEWTQRFACGECWFA